MWLLSAGVVLFVCIILSERLLLPSALETAGRAFYRLAFFIILPARPLVSMFIPQQGNHWPLEHFVFACLLAPVLYWAAWSAGRSLWLRHAPRLRAMFDRKPHPTGAELTRRQFLARSTAGVLGLTTVGMGSYASLVAPQRLDVEEYELPIKDLPKGLDGFRIVHVSDTHYGPYNGLPYLYNAAEQANKLRGDLVLLTGDYVHHTPLSVEKGVGMLTAFESRMGSIAVLGNHDHWEGVDQVRAHFRRAGIPLIDNKRLFLTPDGVRPEPAPGESVCIAGVGDLWDDEVLVDEVLTGLPADMPRLMLSHNPDVAEDLDGTHRVDVMFSGHTHGGQVKVPGLGAPVVPSRYGAKYAGGLCQGPHCPVVVSRGVGVAFLPVRVGVPPEIGLVTLRRA